MKPLLAALALAALLLALLLALLAAAIGVAAAAETQSEEGAASPKSPSPEELAARLNDPAFLAKAKAYTTGNYWLLLADNAITFVALAWLVFSGISSRAWGWLKARAGGGAKATLLYIAGFVLFTTLVALPLDYYDGFVREHAYGFSTQALGGWIADRVKLLGITVVLAALFLVPLYAVIRRFPRSWWVMGAAMGSLFAVLLVAVAPVFIDPIFNKFTPLQDKDLRKTILDMAHRNGIGADEVWEMDASSRSVHDNAYATGLLGTERIVLYDVLVQNYTRDEVAFVMGHEMGHYVEHHVWKGLALAVALIVAGFYLVDRAGRSVIARWPERTGLASLGEISSLPLVLLVLTVFLFVTLPVQSAYSRHLESRADQFGLRAVANPSAAVDSFRKMAGRNLADPDPPALVEWFLYSHPAIGKRIRAAEEYVRRSAPASP